MRRWGFTFAELLIVISIVGILASVAIPNWFVIQHRAQRAELAANGEGIRTAEQGYFFAHGRYLGEPRFRPDPVPSESLRSWDRNSHFESLGWSPEGLVRGSYRVTVSESGEDFLMTGICDVDGDGDFASYTATASVAPLLITRHDTY